VALGCILFELWWLKRPSKWVYAGVVVLGMVLVCLPWGWRNCRAFDAIFFIRSNFGLELRLGNSESASATFDEMDMVGVHYRHPKADFAEARKLRDIGEGEYMRQAQEEAFKWISTHPGEFLSLTAKRFANLWVGPIHRRWNDSLSVAILTLAAVVGALWSLAEIKIPQRAALIIPLITYPLVYYVVAYMPRYRIPVDWLLYILAGSLIWKIIGGAITQELELATGSDR
jgi:hypothetical protein